MENGMMAQEVVRAAGRPLREQESLRKVAKWGKFTGIIMMILGAISALGGLFAFLVGAIPGILTCWMGYLIFQTGKSAERMLYSGNNDDMGSILENYGKFLSINGILMIIALVVGFIGFFLMGAVISEMLYYL